MKLKRRKSVNEILKKKNGLVCLTAYTKPIAKVVDKFADIILVGDSVGPVLYGFETTREVTLDMMIRHGSAVVRNTQNSCIIVDMPYGTYERSKNKAYENVMLLLEKTGACGIKLEGGKEIVPIIEYLVSKEIKVMGHLGMTPQKAVSEKDYKVFGKKEEERKSIFNDVIALEKAGVFSVVIEATLEKVSKQITELINIPTIGIGASVECSGQILVTEDLLGITDFQAKFVKKYQNLDKYIFKAIKNYSVDVRMKRFPSTKHVYK